MKPFTQTKVMIDNPKGRVLNKYGAPAFPADTSWVHSNLVFVGGCPPVEKAFSGTTPFKDLGWTIKPGCPTETVYKWHYSTCPITEKDLWVSFETQYEQPKEFLQYVSDTHDVVIKAKHFGLPRSNTYQSVFQPKEK